MQLTEHCTMRKCVLVLAHCMLSSRMLCIGENDYAAAHNLAATNATSTAQLSFIKDTLYYKYRF